MQILKQLITLFPKKISLAVIFVEYDRQKYGGSDTVFKTLQDYLGKIQGCRTTYLRVDNKDETGQIKKVSKNIYTVGGDNTFREFSGWQKGVKVINSLWSSFDVVLFVNDMFLKPGESFLKDYANTSLLERCLNENTVIGRIDSTGQQYTVYDYDVSQWVCTNCFLAPMQAIAQLKDIVTIKENLEDFLPETFPGPQQNPISFFKENAPINDIYKSWLIEWLTERWHSKFEINAQTWDLFRTKVRNILNESMLTARLGEIGCKEEEYGDKIYY